jgi:Spy/CpxP family protein refolding chaperone
MISVKTFRSIFLALGLASASLFALSARAADEPPAKPAVPADASLKGPLATLARFKSAVYDVKLTNEQKAKIDPLFASAKDDLKSLESTADEKERAAKSRALLNKLKTDVSEELTNEQKLSVLKAMAPPGPGAMIDRIKEQLNNPEMKLTDEQKTKLDAVLDDTKAKLEDLKTQVKSGGGAKEASAKAHEILVEMRGKLTEILSPDQQAHLNGQPAPKGSDTNAPK